MDRQIRHEDLELTVGLGRVGLAEPLLQLRKVDAAIACGNPQLVSDSLAICIGRPGGNERLPDGYEGGASVAAAPQVWSA